MVKKIMNFLLYVMIGFYAFMLCDLFFRYNVLFDGNRVVARSLNLVPFQTIWAYVSGSNHLRATFAISNILGNIIAFIPFGLFLQTIRRRKSFWTSVLIIAVTTVTVEAIQYIFGLGASDIDDVILNTFGGLIGIWLYRLFRWVFREEARTKTAITVATVAVGVPIVYLYFTTVFAHMRL
jgi:glycopeptide antibiotics resistance protein